MATYNRGKTTQSWYGESIGILILDASYPFIPGNIGNASTFPFPVRYEKVEGASIDHLLNQQDPELVISFIKAAQNLFESAGVSQKIPLVIAGMEDQPEFSSAVLKE